MNIEKEILECLEELYKLDIPELEAFNREWQQELDRMQARPKVRYMTTYMVNRVIEWKRKNGLA